MLTKAMELVKECMSYSGAVSLHHNGALSANGSEPFAVHLSEFIPPRSPVWKIESLLPHPFQPSHLLSLSV